MEREKFRHQKARARFEELCVCAVEQDYSIIMEGKIYLDLITILLFKKILKEELNITTKEFTKIRLYGNK